MNKEIECPNCGKTISIASDYCTFCGSKVNKNRQNKETSYYGNVWKIVAAVVLVLAILGGVFLFFNYIKPFNDLKEENEQLEKEATELNDEIKNLKESYENQVKELNKEISTASDQTSALKKDRTQNMNKAQEYNRLIAALEKSGTSNGIISVPSNIYAVKKGESEIIKINWHSNSTTIYAGSNDNNAVDAEWTNDNNLRVIGKGAGITDIRFSSDDSGSNAFYVTIICYE